MMKFEANYFNIVLGLGIVVALIFLLAIIVQYVRRFLFPQNGCYGGSISPLLLKGTLNLPQTSFYAIACGKDHFLVVSTQSHCTVVPFSPSTDTNQIIPKPEEV